MYIIKILCYFEEIYLETVLESLRKCHYRINKSFWLAISKLHKILRVSGKSLHKACFLNNSDESNVGLFKSCW